MFWLLSIMTFARNWSFQRLTPSLLLSQFYFSRMFTPFSIKIMLTTHLAKYCLRTWKSRVHRTCRQIDLQRRFALEIPGLWVAHKLLTLKRKKWYGVPQGPIRLLRNVCKVITQQYYMWKVVINLPVSFLNLTYLRSWSGWRWLDHFEEYIGIPQTVLFLADSAMPWAKACQTVRLPRQVTWA